MAKLVIPNRYMLRSFLIRLEPNNKQKTMLYKSTCTSRWAYNWDLNKKKEYYEKTKKTVSCGDIRKELTQLKKTVRILEKRLKRLQRKVSRKYEKNKIKKGESIVFIKTNNIKRLEEEIQSVRDRLNNIRTNYLHQTSNSIIKQKPSYITIEDLNIKGMMKNKHLSKAVQEQSLYEFRKQLTYKSKRNNIELRVVDRWYPSSKTCSQCGEIKKDLKLKDRIYICPCCGLKIDRDLNASINLSNAEIYEVSL